MELSEGCRWLPTAFIGLNREQHVMRYPVDALTPPHPCTMPFDQLFVGGCGNLGWMWVRLFTPYLGWGGGIGCFLGAVIDRVDAEFVEILG